VLTVDTLAQAADRAGGPGATEDKGWSATVAALDAALALRHVNTPSPVGTKSGGTGRADGSGQAQ
jgi:hypothetical protein